MAVSARLVHRPVRPLPSRAHGLFASLGVHSLRMLGAAIALFALTWTVGFRRHYRRTLEAEDAGPRVRSADQIRIPWSDRPKSAPSFRFSGKTLARSRKHQLFLVTYLSVGISLARQFRCDGPWRQASALGGRSARVSLPDRVLRDLRFPRGLSIPGRAGLQLALPHHRSALGGDSRAVSRASEFW